MLSFFLLVALGTAGRAAPTSISPLIINMPVPGAAECDPLLITFSGGIRVCRVQTNPILPTPLVEFASVTGTSLTWIVNATLGISLILEFTDDNDATTTSGSFNVITGGTLLRRFGFARSLTCAMLQQEMGASMGIGRKKDLLNSYLLCRAAQSFSRLVHLGYLGRSKERGRSLKFKGLFTRIFVSCPILMRFFYFKGADRTSTNNLLKMVKPLDMGITFLWVVTKIQSGYVRAYTELP
ncbi:hypothetical protein C8R45DRAFT_934404 [Mycena sanguinolenta]|nr:hypothetical protein C8R45DRAFT_934404 [Mycena sanguinolenta]